MTASRRSFLGAAAAGIAAGTVIGGAAGAAAPRAFTRTSPSATELIKVGIITCREYSHILDIWGPFLNPPTEAFRGARWPRTTGMVMTTVWDADRAAAESFAKQYDIRVADHYADMVGKVDAVIFSGFYEVGWWPRLTKPYLEAGIPCLINRPFALSLAEAREMVDRARTYGAPIYVPSPFETRGETLRLRDEVRRIRKEGGTVTGAFANQTTREYPAHGCHGIYGMYAILEPVVKAVSFKADGWWEFENGFVTWRCGQEGGPDYYMGLNLTWGTPLAWRMVLTTKGKLQDDIDWSGGTPDMRLVNHHYPLLYEFAKMVETGEMPQSYEYILDKTTVFLTGFYSHCEHGGDMVACSDLPPDWRAPEVHPDWIPESVFD